MWNRSTENLNDQEKEEEEEDQNQEIEKIEEIEQEENRLVIKLVPIEEGVPSSDDRSCPSFRKPDDEESKQICEISLVENQYDEQQNESIAEKATSNDSGRTNNLLTQPNQKNPQVSVTSKEEPIIVKEFISGGGLGTKQSERSKQNSTKLMTSSAGFHSTNQPIRNKSNEKRLIPGKSHTLTNFSKTPAFERNKISPRTTQAKNTNNLASFSIDKTANSPLKKAIDASTTIIKKTQNADPDVNLTNRNSVRQQEYSLELVAKKLNATTLLVSSHLSTELSEFP